MRVIITAFLLVLTALFASLSLMNGYYTKKSKELEEKMKEWK